MQRKLDLYCPLCGGQLWVLPGHIYRYDVGCEQCAYNYDGPPNTLASGEANDLYNAIHLFYEDAIFRLDDKFQELDGTKTNNTEE